MGRGVEKGEEAEKDRRERGGGGNHLEQVEREEERRGERGRNGLGREKGDHRVRKSRRARERPNSLFCSKAGLHGYCQVTVVQSLD